MAAMAALGRIGQPEEIANLVLFLASDEPGWISAQNAQFAALKQPALLVNGKKDVMLYGHAPHSPRCS